MIKLDNSKIKNIKGIYKECTSLRLVLKKNELTLSSIIDDQYISSIIDVENKDNINFDIYVNKTFLNYIEKKGAVLVYQPDRLFVKNKNINININMLIDDDNKYNAIDVSKKLYVKFNKKEFFDLLNKSIKQIAKEPYKPALKYIYMSYENKQMVTTDGRVMSIYDIDFEGTLKENIYLFEGVIKKLLKNNIKIKDDDVIYIYKDSNHILIEDNNILLTSNIEASLKYPNYSKVIPVEYDINIPLAYNEIIQIQDILKEAKTNIERSKMCTLKFHNNELSINTTLNDISSEFQSSIVLNNKIDKDFDISFNIEYLINIISYCEDNMQILINFGSTPTKFVLNDHQSIVLMPMSS